MCQECASEIENTFAVLRRALAAREKAMLSRLKSVSDRKKNALKEQLNNLQDLYDDCSQVFDTATSIINAGTVSEDEHAGIYMVATAHAVQRRTEELTKIFDNSDNVPIADPSIKCIFDDAECKQIEEVIQTLGWLGTTDYPPALTEAESKNRQNENIENEFINGKEPDSHSYKAENIVSFNADENIVDIPVLISLNIQSGYCVFLYFNTSCIIFFNTGLHLNFRSTIERVIHLKQYR